ncbi:hypothetical protein [Gallibacter intestinalis]|uniref:Nucleotidyltransferase n=1 Tax=Gallibacter intestinalis TaxID=2779356 RepID=A0ABR9QV23_9FIRM|nr:hypothetical protein [Gallibacter intestinalis]MBE5034724.1 hypothetical protein [Gallibacter intestinalis]
MYHFEYVPKEEWKPVKENLEKIIRDLQNEVRNDFTFQYSFVGSSSRNMITCDRNSNVGFDFDVNIEVNDPDEKYSANEIRNIIRSKLDTVIYPFHNSGWRNAIPNYDNAEDSTRVITIKVKDKPNSRILHSCDFCIVRNCSDGRQQYIRFNKNQNYYSWELQPKGYYKLQEKIEWIKNENLWQKVRDCYIEKKNRNDTHKKSRSIFAEAVHEVCQRNGYYR